MDKRNWPFLSLLLTVLLPACAGKGYDMSEGLNTELTLFEEEVSVPVGKIGPFTLSTVLDRLSAVEGIGTLLSDYIKVDHDGALYLEDSETFYRDNIYEVERSTGDVSAPFTWHAGSPSGSVGGVPAVLSLLGLKAPSQQLELIYTNPLRSALPIRCAGRLVCYDSSWQPSYTATLETPGSLSRRAADAQLTRVSLPMEVTDVISNFSLDNLEVDFPANPTSNIWDPDLNCALSMAYRYRCGIAAGESFALPGMSFDVGEVNLPIGAYKLHKCEVSVELENTLPLAVTVDKLEVLRKVGEEESASYEVDPDVAVSGLVKVAGGSPVKPAVTPMTVTLEALSGTVPDIEAIRITLSVEGQPGLGVVPFSVNQGLLVKSSSATLHGGITIPKK